MRKTTVYFIVFSILLLSSISKSDTIVDNTVIGFSVYLPANWTATQINDSQAYFYDTSLTYKSQIAIKKHTLVSTDYPEPTDWTRAHFIAYLLVAQYSYDPFGSVLYFDSSAASQQDGLWAPEAFTEFYTIDTIPGAWNEYMRYTSTANSGYEIYALGDTTDMKLNIGMYMAIIQMIDILGSESATVKYFKRSTSLTSTNKVPAGYYNLLGKKFPGTTISPINNSILNRADATLRVIIK